MASILEIAQKSHDDLLKEYNKCNADLNEAWNKLTPLMLAKPAVVCDDAGHDIRWEVYCASVLGEVRILVEEKMVERAKLFQAMVLKECYGTTESAGA